MIRWTGWLKVLMVLSLLIPAAVSAEKIAGISLPETLTAADQNLALHGAGIRKKLWIKVYAAGLYLPPEMQSGDRPGTPDAASVIAADQPMALRMHFIYDSVSREKLIEAWNEGFENATGNKTEPIAGGIREFNGCFREALGPGDIVDLVYVPGTGTEVIVKGDSRAVIPGLPFKQALFGIWLCDEPADDDLKEGLLKLQK
ncbi:MAG TPA: chalcone isomerase family protein [bacterium]|nr:chalcone isomerase family protein [bacterium]